MEPNSDTFIAFFTLTGSSNTTVDIHNVIDGEIYYAISSEKPDRIVVQILFLKKTWQNIVFFMYPILML
jgi:hypothetical protein